MFELMDSFSQTAVIKVIGVGGGGGNAVSHMAKCGIEGVEFICVNTDAQALKHSQVKTSLQIGANITKGLGAGANPETGRQAAMEDRDRIIELIEGCDMLFITAGMGGGTGTGAAPVVAQVARELGILTVAVVTRPFTMEGNKRAAVAEAGMTELSRHVDSLITIPNQKLLQVLGGQTTLLEAFKPLREHVNVVTGLRAPDPFGHHVIGSLWLSGGSARPTQGSDVQAGQTIDQHIADAIGRDTPLRSLELGIEDINSSSNSCQFGWSCLYLNTLSWQTPTMPLPNEQNPQSAFERMFGDIGSAEERAARFKSKASILDSVVSAASRLNSQLPPQDRSTVEEYLESIREVESRIQSAGQRAGAAGETPDAPAGIPGSYDEHVRVMYDLIALAWRADITRVTTFMKGV